MEAKDTVITNKRYYEIGEACNWSQGCSGVPAYIEKSFLEQAETTWKLAFKEGIKEVVEWTERNITFFSDKDTAIWQAKLKEWALTNARLQERNEP